MHFADSGLPVFRSYVLYRSMGSVSGRVSMIYLPGGIKPFRQSTLRIRGTSVYTSRNE